ncbi:MAG: ATP-binding protein, partial [Rhodanobacteraceae bacterium]
AQLVKQMLTFARGADGERVLVQPSYLVEEVARIAGETFPKSIVVGTKFPQDLWMIEADPTQLQQVLLNLCVNARDAMPEGGSLRISAENFTVDEHYASMTAGAQPGPHVMLQISDNGTGIPRHVIDKIFDPFFTTKEIGAGTGLGLSTVIGIVKSYGGFINVYSEPGHTSFKVFLPASNAIPDKIESAESRPLPQGHGERILVVDDEPSIRTAAQTLLEGCGYHPLLAEDGVSALALYAQSPKQFDLVLTDLVMPLMDGAMLIRALRKLNPEQKVVISTGRDEEVQSPHVKSLNVEACLLKPHSRDKLLRTLDDALRSAPHVR